MAETATSELSILIRIRDEASAALGRLAGEVSELGGQMGFAGDKSGILAGGLAAIGGTTILAAIGAFQQAQFELKQAEAIFGRFPDSTKMFNAAIEKGNEVQRQFGFDNEGVTLALAKFYQATGGDMPKALNALQAAMGLSITQFGGTAGFGQAVDSVMKLLAGKGARSLSDFGIDLGDLSEKFSPESGLAFVIDQTKERLNAFSGTLVAQKGIMGKYGSDILENMGEPYGIVIQKVLEFTNKIINLGKVIGDTKPIWEGMGISLGIVSGILVIKAIPQLVRVAAGFLGISGAAAITGTAIFAAVATFAFWVIAIGLVIAAAIYLVRHWKEVKEQLVALWELIKIGAEIIWNKMADFIKNVFGGAMDWVREQLKKIIDFYQEVVRIVSVPIKIVGSMIGGVKSFLGLAEGGIVTRPTFAMIGEAGPEAVIPLNRLGGMGGGINIYLQGDFYTTDEIAEKFASKLAQLIKLQIRV